MPVDGTVVDGVADVDESVITGESRAVTKEVGGTVVAGTVASGGSLRVRVTAVGDGTALSGIMRLVAEAQASGSRAQVLAVTVDVRERPELARKYGVAIVPTAVAVAADGRVTTRLSG